MKIKTKKETGQFTQVLPAVATASTEAGRYRGNRQARAEKAFLAVQEAHRSR
jgi:hypothetical protein